MTQKEFLKLLRKTPREWTRDPDGAIRIPSGESVRHCPISYLGQGMPCVIYTSASRLGLSAFTADNIVGAADGLRERKWLRKRLLQACGLKESR